MRLYNRINGKEYQIKSISNDKYGISLNLEKNQSMDLKTVVNGRMWSLLGEHPIKLNTPSKQEK